MIKFNEPFITGTETKYLLDVIKRGQFFGVGHYTTLCQTSISNILGAKRVLLTDSCTSALEIIALLLREWSLEQEVIVPSYTFSSTAAAFARAGYKVTFCEIDPETLMIDLEDAERRITAKTVAVVGVHYGGNVFDLVKAKTLCEKYNIKLVEDAAQAFGCFYQGKAIGLFGDFAAFSFHETKNLHCGLGGALVVNEADYYDRASYIWERGTNRQEVLKGLVDKYSWVEIGGSHYPTEMQAAFLYSQLEKFEQNLRYRKNLYESYRKIFEQNNLKQLRYIVHEPNLSSNYHAFWVIFPNSEECDFVRLYLKNLKINAFIGYVPLHSSKVGQSMGYLPENLPITEHSAQLVLRLPLHNNLSPDQAEYIADKVMEAVLEYRK